MEHVGVGEDDAGALTDGAAGVGGGVAVVGEDAEVGTHVFDEGVEFFELVFGEGFGGEEVEGAGSGVLGEGVEDGEVVAEGFAGGGGSDDDDVFVGDDGVPGVGLVGVEALDATGDEDFAEFGGEGFREVGEDGGARRGAADGADGRVGTGGGLRLEFLDQEFHIPFAWCRGEFRKHE